jgi:hypothetical protein
MATDGLKKPLVVEKKESCGARWLGRINPRNPHKEKREDREDKDEEDKDDESKQRPWTVHAYLTYLGSKCVFQTMTSNYPCRRGHDNFHIYLFSACAPTIAEAEKMLRRQIQTMAASMPEPVMFQQS